MVKRRRCRWSMVAALSGAAGLYVSLAATACNQPADVSKTAQVARPGAAQQTTIPGPILGDNSDSGTGPLFLVTGICDSQPLTLPNECQTLAELILDVGGANDHSALEPIYLVPPPSGLSAPIEGPGENEWHRTLAQGSTLEFRVSAAALTGLLQSNGVPDHHDAIIDIEFQDVVNEMNCDGASAYNTECRPYLRTRLDWGTDPVSETWFHVRDFAGTADDNWKIARFFFEGNDRQMLRAIGTGTSAWMRLAIDYPDQAQAGDPLPINTITLRFIDKGCFEDLREDDRVLRSLVRADFQEANTLNPSNYPQQDYVIYKRNYLQKIYPNTIPHPSEIIPYDNPPALTAFEVPGQTEPVTFAIYAFDDLPSVQIVPGILTLQGGTATIPSVNIRIHHVVATDKRWAWGLDPYYGAQPWYLDDTDTFSVTAATSPSQQVWLLIDVPEDAQPGTYLGQVSVLLSSGQPQSRTLPLALTVYAVTLDEPDVPVTILHSPYGPGARYAKTPDIAGDNLHDLHAHSVNTWITPQWNPYDNPIVVTFPQASTDEVNGLRVRGILGTELHCFVSDARDYLWKRLCSNCLDQSGEPDYCCECPNFDDVYTNVLEQYKDWYEDFHTDPDDPQSPCLALAVAFVDEPGRNVARRCEANHLNRLAQAAGVRTSFTYYYPECEEPLGGAWTFRFRQLARGIKDRNSVSPGDPNMLAFWDFNVDGQLATDVSIHENDATLHGECMATAGVMTMVEGSSNYMWVWTPTDALDITDYGTVSFWFKPASFPMQNVSAQLLNKRGADSTYANYRVQFYHPTVAPAGLAKGVDVRERIGEDNQYSLSGAAIFEDADLNNWCNLTWVYDVDKGGTLYVNGAPFAVPSVGPLTVTHFALVSSGFTGDVDDLAILNRAMTEAEIAPLIDASTDPDFRNQSVVLSMVLPAGDMPPNNTITFSIGDRVRTPTLLETTKRLMVNDHVVWEADYDTGYPLPSSYGTYAVNLTNVLDAGQQNTVSWEFTNGNARLEDISLYFVEDYWREGHVYNGNNIAFTVVEQPEPTWTATFTTDPTGDLGPMSRYVDEPIFSIYRMNQETLAFAALHDDWTSRGFYLPTMSTQAVIVNNRFLYGLYASALNMTESHFYAYSDTGSEPWDDQTSWEHYPACQDRGYERGSGNYQLILPSWEDKVYNTLSYESLREAIEDSRVISTLKSAIVLHPGEAADCASEYLAEIFDKLNPDFAPRYCHVTTTQPIEQYADSSDIMLTDLSGSPVGFGIFDEIRLRLLRHIQVIVDGIGDCNGNGVPDEYDIGEGGSDDVNGNGVPDECEDCDVDGIPDPCEISCQAAGCSEVQGCGGSADCNGNGVPDECDIGEGRSEDVNGNGVPDECEDCDVDGIPDPCEISCQAAGCSEVQGCGGSADCNGNGVPDECDINPLDPDGDLVYYVDKNSDGVPDICVGWRFLMIDCNGNMIEDGDDIFYGYSEDCNENYIPDECDVDPDDPDADGIVSVDGDADGIPDSCE